MEEQTIIDISNEPADSWIQASPAAEFTAEPSSATNAQGYLARLGASAGGVHRFVARRVANTADAEEIAQQALFLACSKLDTFRGKNLEGWLYSIARNLIVDHYRAQGRYEFLEVDEAAQGEAEPALRTLAETMHSVCDCRERVRSWVDCISRSLRLEQQVAVLLADVHGHCDKDSAAMVGTSVPSFKLLLHESRTRLHQTAGGTCTLVKEPSAAAHPGKGIARASTAGCAGCASGGCRDAKGCVDKDAATSNRASGECCVGLDSCSSRKCCFAVNCRLGLKCCRNVPKLVALRARLLESLTLN